MPRFTIIKIDPQDYKQDILHLWEEYLPGTPPGRFEWMGSNPAGPADWFLAINTQDGDIAGMISIIPKSFHILGQDCRAGIVGDFVVKKQYRVFGPSIALMKHVLNQRCKLNYAFLYTLPNAASAAVCLHGGFSQLALTDRYVKVLRPGKRIAGYLPRRIASFAAICDLGYSLISKETYMKTSLSADDVKSLSELQEDLLAEPDKAEFSKGVQDLGYTQWRYFQNPLFQYRLTVCREFSGSRRIGKLISTSIGRRIFLYDFWSLGNENIRKILATFIKRSRDEGFETISIRTIENTPLSSEFKRAGFIAKNEKIPLLFAGSPERTPKYWHFFDGDRNI